MDVKKTLKPVFLGCTIAVGVGSLLFVGFGVLFGIIWSGAHSPDKYYHAKERGVEFLTNIQRSDGAICDTVNPLFDTWETVIAAEALFETGVSPDSSVLKNAMAYLQTNEDSAGMLCHNQKCRAAYCLETTAEYFLLQGNTGKRAIAQGNMDTVLKLQKPTGQWEIGNPDVQERKDFPSVTAFVVNMIDDADYIMDNRNIPIQWLVNHQNAEGHWRSSWEYYGCPAYALWPIMRVLRDEDSVQAQGAVRKAELYMIAQQISDGSWYFTDPRYKKSPSKELQTALMVLALERSNSTDAQAAYKRGVDFLVSYQQPDGHWNGGYFPIDNPRYVKEEYVFATAMAMRALSGFERRD